MPQVLNGCGTWYYGKKNLQQYAGTCRACGAYTTLTSYDTRLYVVVFFIPVIPLRAKHITEECAVCRRHFALPLAEWKTAQKRTDEAIAAYRRSPHDPELAKEALGASAGHRNLPALMSVAPDVEKGLAAHPETLRMLAAAYEMFSRTDDAERVLRTALAADEDSHETREMLAECLLNQGRPHEAEPFLEHVVEEGIPDRVDLLYRLGQGYQMKGEHDKALEVFDQCEAIFPAIAQDDTYKRLRAESDKRRGSKVAVRPGEVERQAKSAESRRKAMKVAPVVVAVAALAYVALCFFFGTRRSVYLVNGLGKPYVVRVNGTQYTLHPRTPTPVYLAEGDVKVEIPDAPPPLNSATVPLHTSFLTRPFSGATFVLNPDRTAILLKQRVYYTPKSYASAGDGPKGEESVHVGRVLNRFDGIDYVFEQFPDSLRMESGSRKSRDRVALADESKMPAPMMLMAAAKDSGRAAVAEAARTHLLMEPDRGEFLGVLYQTMEPAELAAFLRPRLEGGPVRVQWHRAYQEAMEKSGQADRLEPEYAARLARDPKNKDLMYLAARAMKGDTDKALSILREASAEPNPSGFALFSLCAYHLCNADFRLAADLAEKTLKALPEQPEVKFYAKEALLADRRYDRLLELLTAEHAGPVPTVMNAYADEAYIHALKGDRGAAGLAEQALRGELREYDKDFVERQVRRVEAQLAYADGNPGQFAEILAAADDPEDLIVAHLTTGDLAAAEEALAKSKPSAHLHLLFYLAAHNAGKQDAAGKHLKAAVEFLEKDDRDDRAFAKALQGQRDKPLDELLRARGVAVQKATLLTALGVRDPSAREKCFELARKLNYDRRFPHLLLSRAMGDPPPPGPRPEKATP